MNIAIIGTGYVGLVQGAVFANAGNDVICMDVDENKITQLQGGKIPIYEPGLEELVKHHLKDGRLQFSTSLDETIPQSDILFLCLPTPQTEDGSADLQHILGAVEQIIPLLQDGKILVSKSTVPVGTADKIREILEQKGIKRVPVVSNPEFLKEGAAVQDSLKPDRVIVGTMDENARDMMADLYEPFLRTGNAILFMDPRSAELTKYAANALLATKITFMNELANLCDVINADIDWVRKGIGADPRIGPQFLFPGPGYGGSCFPKDVKALEKLGDTAGNPLRIVHAVDIANERQKNLLALKVRGYYGDDLTGKTIAVWGISFKPNTDDVREAPAFTLIDGLLEGGASVRVFDPAALSNTRAAYGPKIEYSEDEYEVLREADCLVIVTEWNVFRRPDYDRMKSLLKQPLIFDGRNVFDPAKMASLGFEYIAMGRPGSMRQ